ncbi:protein NYNRIN-like [Macrobrachium rosenbergii]|uniref:protein NYNRIN-like n=1 Tax=Macrobrachium rosenbergii TaxID=79674 RepID=UPI0034D3CC60
MAAASKTPRGPAPVGFYVRDTVSGRTMLIDTGAMRSVFPPFREDLRCLPDPTASLTAANLVFDVIYGLSHPSGRTTARLLAEKFIWHGIRKEATAWARQCIQCQASKVGWHTRSGVGDFPQPGKRFRHIHVDVVGPLPPSGGARYLLTVINRSTRWPEATPMEEATSSAHAEGLLSSWISCFGAPDHITTDRGPAFLSNLWTALARLLGTTHHSTAYNPTASGMVERFHRSLKASLMACCTSENWKYLLPWVLLRLRTAPRTNGDPSAAEKVFGETLVVPGELITEDQDDLTTQRLHDRVGKFAPCRRTYTNRTSPFMPPGLSSATQAFVRDDAVHPPLTRTYRGLSSYLRETRRHSGWLSVGRKTGYR